MPQSAVARKISVWYTGDNKSQGVGGRDLQTYICKMK